MTHNTPEKPHRSDSPGPAASETPQDAREVERRERWLRQHPDGDMGWEKIGRYDQRVVTNLMAEADREHAALVAERDRARDLAARLEEELAQAAGEAPRREMTATWRGPGVPLNGNSKSPMIQDAQDVGVCRGE